MFLVSPLTSGFFALAGVFLCLAVPFIITVERMHAHFDYYYSQNKLLHSFGALHLFLTKIIMAVLKLNKYLLILAGIKLLWFVLFVN